MKFTRGDTFEFKFQRKNKNGEVITTMPDKMWFTMKRNGSTDKKLIQKTLETGISVDSAHFYHIVITHNETKNLEYGTYKFDIQIAKDTAIKTIYKGEIELTEEITFEGANNE